MVEIVQAQTIEQVGLARQLFREYETWLGMNLCFQGFEEELRDLPGKYARPGGRLLLAHLDGEPAGCIALRPIDNEICEMKRLYLRDIARGRGIGNTLIEMVIDEACIIGYKKMRLDTYPPKMPKAVKLYESHNFHQIRPYYNNPHKGVLFMERDL